MGELDDAGAVAETLAGAGAALILLGPRQPYTDVFCEDATRAIVVAMRAADVPRLVCLTGAMIGDYRDNRGRLFRWMGHGATRRMAESMRDRAAQEAVVHTSGLRWAIVKPSRLTEGPRTGRVAAKPDLRLGLRSAISRKDLADVLLDACTEDGPTGAIFVAQV